MVKSSVKFLLSIALLGFVLAQSVSAAAQGSIEGGNKKEHAPHPQWFLDSPFLDLQEDLQTALADDKSGLMVLYTTEGCSYCDKFIRTSLGNSQIAEQVQASFDSIGLEIFDDSEMTAPPGDALPVKEFATREGAGFAPTLLFYGSNGERIFRAVGYQSPDRFTRILDYLSSKAYLEHSFRSYLEQQAPTAAKPAKSADLRADPLFMQPPIALDRSHFAAEKPLVVLFEQAACAECELFHDEVLANDEVRKTLQQFEIVRLDIGDDQTPVLAPDGSRIKPAGWYDQTGFSRVPALLFIDEGGRVALQTDAVVGRGRMMNSLNFMLEQAYEKGWTYQRFARSKGIERAQKARQQQQGAL
mgnify:FL=1